VVEIGLGETPDALANGAAQDEITQLKAALKISHEKNGQLKAALKISHEDNGRLKVLMRRDALGEIAGDKGDLGEGLKIREGVGIIASPAGDSTSLRLTGLNEPLLSERGLCSVFTSAGECKKSPFVQQNCVRQCETSKPSVGADDAKDTKRADADAQRIKQLQADLAKAKAGDATEANRTKQLQADLQKAQADDAKHAEREKSDAQRVAKLQADLAKCVMRNDATGVMKPKAAESSDAAGALSINKEATRCTKDAYGFMVGGKFKEGAWSRRTFPSLCALLP
jgi:hypothetical protein